MARRRNDQKWGITIGERDNNGYVGVQRLVSAGRLRWRLVYADEESSIVVDDEGRDGDMWATRSLVRTTLLQLMRETMGLSVATKATVEMGVVVWSVLGWLGENGKDGDEMQTVGRNG